MLTCFRSGCLGLPFSVNPHFHSDTGSLSVVIVGNRVLTRYDHRGNVAVRVFAGDLTDLFPLDVVVDDPTDLLVKAHKFPGVLSVDL